MSGLFESKPYKAIGTIPNIITGAGIGLIILSFYGFFIENRWLLFSGLFFSGVSDLFDGFLARKLNQSTKLGEVIDSLRDKMLLLSTVLYLIIICYIQNTLGIIFFVGLFIFCICQGCIEFLNLYWRPHHQIVEAKLELICKVGYAGIVFIAGGGILDHYFRDIIVQIWSNYQYINPSLSLLGVALLSALTLAIYLKIYRTV